jgi:hypothetical protein
MEVGSITRAEDHNDHKDGKDIPDSKYIAWIVEEEDKIWRQ